MREYNYLQSVKKYLENCRSKKNEIVIIGNDVFTLEIYFTIKSLLEYRVSFIVTENPDIFKNINTELQTEEEFKEHYIPHENQFYMVAKMTEHKEAYELLHNKGLRLNEDFAIMGIGGYTKLLNAIDSLLTLNRIDEGIIGFDKYSNDLNDEKKIVILGNSTSDSSTGNLKSWPQYLFEKFDAAGISITLLNGAVTGYSSTQEYLKLSRDVLQLQPDLVISFSGYNDVKGNSTVDKFPFLHKYQNKFYEFLKKNPRLAPDSMYVRNVTQITHGIENRKNDYEIWVDNMRKMNAICSEFGIQFLSYLQPMVFWGGALKSESQEKIIKAFMEATDSESMINGEKEFCDGVKSLIKGKSYIKDITDIFRDKYNVFYDTCHCTEIGNQILANRVYEDILAIMSLEK